MNYRTAAQVVVKTVVTYSFGITIFAQACALQRIPWKHNSRIFRIAVFFIFPGITFGMLFLNLLQAISRLLQHLLDADLNNFEVDYPFLNFCWNSALGVYAREEKPDESTDDKDLKTCKLVDISLSNTVRKKHTPWTWSRYGEILITLLALTQALGSIVVFAMRVDQRELVGIDCRNFWIATASVVSSIIGLALLIWGNDWIVEPEAANTARRSSEPRKIMLEFFVGAVFQQSIQILFNRDRNDPVPKFSIATVLLAFTPRNGLEIVLAIVLVLAATVFKDDLVSRLNLSPRSISNATVLLTIALVGWAFVDVMIVFVTDMMSFGFIKGTEWTSSLEERILVI